MVLKQCVDLLILILVTAWVGWLQPVLGIMVLLFNVLFATQYWKTVLLVGSSVEPSSTARRVKAAILAAVFTVFLAMVLLDEPAAPQSESIVNLWNHDYFPVVLALGFLSSFLMAAVIVEKRKR